MPATDPNTLAHLEWLGFIQPHGVVVSPPALLKAGAFLNRNDAAHQALLAGCMEQPADGEDAPPPEPRIRDFQEFARTVLGWRFSPKGFAGTDDAPIPDELTLPLPDYGETLRPDFAVRERDPRDGAPPWQLLVQVLLSGRDFDRVPSGPGLDASPQGRAERLLRATGVPAGMLVNDYSLRLISAPRGETSGWIDFHFADLATTAGRPLCSALHLLLSEQRLLALPRDQAPRRPAARQPPLPERSLRAPRRAGPARPLRTPARLPRVPPIQGAEDSIWGRQAIRSSRSSPFATAGARVSRRAGGAPGAHAKVGGVWRSGRWQVQSARRQR